MADRLLKLPREERLQLMQFICSFAWADLLVSDKERAFVRKMIERLQLDEAEVQLVRGWLEVPPAPEDVDPMKIPRAHREIFLDAARKMIAADGQINAEEHENLALLEQLTR